MYLHEAALANNPPSQFINATGKKGYDPERDGTVCGSLGTHEHWNNMIDKKYTRNLGIGNGIELVYTAGAVPPVGPSPSCHFAFDEGSGTSLTDSHGRRESKRKYFIIGACHIDLAWKKTSEEMSELLESFVVRLLDLLGALQKTDAAESGLGAPACGIRESKTHRSCWRHGIGAGNEHALRRKFYPQPDPRIALVQRPHGRGD
jgi:hypothetical protein